MQVRYSKVRVWGISYETSGSGTGARAILNNLHTNSIKKNYTALGDVVIISAYTEKFLWEIL